MLPPFEQHTHRESGPDFCGANFERRDWDRTRIPLLPEEACKASSTRCERRYRAARLRVTEILRKVLPRPNQDRNRLQKHPMKMCSQGIIIAQDPWGAVSIGWDQKTFCAASRSVFSRSICVDPCAT